MDKKKQLTLLAKKLKSHDWTYQKSDDNRAYKRGETEWNEISDLIGKLEASGAGDEAKKIWDKVAPKGEEYPKPKNTKKQPKYKFDKDGNVIAVWDAWDQKWNSNPKGDDTSIWVGSKYYDYDPKTGNWINPRNGDVLTKKILGKRIYEIKQKIVNELSTLREGKLFDSSSADSVVKELKKGIKAPFVSVKKSELGGQERVSIIITISLDPKSDWANGIIQNSRLVRFYLENEGVLEMFNRSHLFKGTKKFRKSKVKSVSDVVNKINKYIDIIDK